jgi:hypothetical protein
MANIGLNISFTGYTGYLIIKVKEASNPAAYVHTSPAIPFDVDQVYDIPDLNPVVHLIEFWRSADGVALTELLRTWSVDAGILEDAVVEEFDYVVDRGETNVTQGTGSEVWADPALDDTELTDERLDGITQDFIRLESRGFGKYRNDEFEMITGGGIRLLGGNTFAETGNTFTVTVYKKTASQISDGPSGTGDYNDIHLVSANGDFDEDYYKTNNVANSSANVLTTTFPDLSLIPNTKAKFSTYNGTQRYWALQFDSGDTVKFRGEDKNIIWLGKDELIEIEFKDGAAYVTHYEGDYRRLGMRIPGDKQELNTLKLDGTQYNIADYPRFYYDFIAKLDASQIKTEAQWATSTSAAYLLNEDLSTQESKTIFPNKGFYAVDLLAGKFRVPDDRNKFIRTLKTFDLVDVNDLERTSNKPGAYQIDQIKAHNHKIGGLWNESGQGNPAGGANFDETPNFVIKKTGGNETRGENVGMIALVVI